MYCKFERKDCEYAGSCITFGVKEFNERKGIHISTICYSSQPCYNNYKKNKAIMKDFVKRMIEEHAQLIVRISALDAYVYGDASDKDDKVEFANKMYSAFCYEEV